MIKLSSKPNVVTPGGDYPYGRIKDDTGGGNGTPVSVQVYGDQHQFFERIMALSGLTANDLPDNSTNGFQLVEALFRISGLTAWTNAGTPTVSVVAGTGTVAVHGTLYNRYKLQGKTLIWECTFSINTTGTPTIIAVNYPTPITVVGAVSYGRTAVGEYQNDLLFVRTNTAGVQIQRPSGNFSGAGGFAVSFTKIIEIA